MIDASNSKRDFFKKPPVSPVLPCSAAPIDQPNAAVAKPARLPTENYHTTHLAIYRQRILEKTEYVNLRGIPMPRDREGQRIALRIPLDRLYIDVQIIKEDQKADNENKKPEPEYPEDVVHNSRRVIIKGSPGCGKTTILRFLTRRWAKESISQLPVLVSLRDYATAVSNDPTLSLREFALSREAAGDESLRRAIATRADAGDIVWLIDALDEARDQRYTAAEQVSTLPGWIVLTSRPVDFVHPPGTWATYVVLPFEPKDVGHFLYRWFEWLAASRGENHSRSYHRATWLEEQLSKRMNLQPLITNPLLLTFIAILAGEDPQRELPRTRAALYRSYVTELLHSWEHERQPPAANAVTRSEKEERNRILEGFSALGWALHLISERERKEGAPVKSVVEQQIDQYFGVNTLGDSVITFWEAAGVLHIGKNDQDKPREEAISFRHLTLQEYAAADVLARSWRKDMHRTWSFLRLRLHYEHWRESILLLANMLPGDEAITLIQMVLNARSFLERYLRRDLRLAYTMAREIPDLPKVVMDDIEFKCSAIQKKYPPNHIASNICKILDRVWLGCFVEMWRANYDINDLWEREPDPGQRFHGITIHSPYNASPSSVSAETQALNQIVSQLHHRNALVRQSAARKLGAAGNAESISYLMATVKKDEDPWVRATAIESLGLLNAAQAASVMIEAVTDRYRIVRVKALNALKRVDLSTRIEILRAASVHDDYRIRLAVIEILGNRGLTDALNTASLALGDSNKEVQLCAAEALGKMGTAEAVPALISAMNSCDQNLRQAAAEALGKIGAPVGIAPLSIIALDSQEDIHLRELALNSLGLISTSAAIPPLMAALRGGTRQLRKVAAEALGTAGASEAVPALISMLKYGASCEKAIAAEALSRIGRSAEQTAAAALIYVVRACHSKRYERTRLFFLSLDQLVESLVMFVFGLVGIHRFNYHAPWEGARTRAAEALERLSPFLKSVRATRKAAHVLAKKSEARAAETLSSRLVVLRLQKTHMDDLCIPEKRTRLMMTILRGLCASALAFALNVWASNLPEWMQPYTRLAWLAVFVLVPVALLLQISGVARPKHDKKGIFAVNAQSHCG